MPDAQHQYIAAFRQSHIAHDITGGAKPNHDLSDVGIFGRPAEIGEFLQLFQRDKDRSQRAFRRRWIVNVEKFADALDIGNRIPR